jgi:hypothetical protein
MASLIIEGLALELQPLVRELLRRARGLEGSTRIPGDRRRRTAAEQHRLFSKGRHHDETGRWVYDDPVHHAGVVTNAGPSARRTATAPPSTSSCSSAAACSPSGPSSPAGARAAARPLLPARAHRRGPRPGLGRPLPRHPRLRPLRTSPVGRPAPGLRGAPHGTDQARLADQRVQGHVVDVRRRRLPPGRGRSLSFYAAHAPSPTGALIAGVALAFLGTLAQLIKGAKYIDARNELKIAVAESLPGAAAVPGGGLQTSSEDGRGSSASTAASLACAS